MNKPIIPILIALILFSIPAYPFSSSSYLIANTAVKFFDYKKAYSHLSPNNENLNERDLQDKLLTFTNLNLIDAATKIAKQILETNTILEYVLCFMLLLLLLIGKLRAYELFSFI